MLFNYHANTKIMFFVDRLLKYYIFVSARHFLWNQELTQDKTTMDRTTIIMIKGKFHEKNYCAYVHHSGWRFFYD